MSDIRFYNRYTGQTQVEEVYGESFLRWTYETAMGRVGLWLLAKRAVFSHWYGWRMNKPSSKRKILPFVATYGLKEEEFLDPVETYSNFNDFFYRKLKPEARPVAEGASSVALPADARHLAIADLENCDGLYVKGQRFDLPTFLGDAALAERFADGVAVISRLCPVDYHRYHSPVSGKLMRQRLINGDLYSVSPIALRRSASYLWQNKRVLTELETESLGTVAFVAIGATCVGSIIMTAKEGQSVSKGDELGYFAFGGSCVVSLFEKGRLQLSEDLKRYGAKQLEVYARVGDELGRVS
ncbi:archaetidylserine decarboxylase [Pelagicoccus sp. SDUM812003]|uniref:archaetidylserine decarboxylase n=1 Tax=Pelagicoccus sp. SDUM812003 TaxID=3041267 RepID=UPI00280E7C2B|nr:archaetidylserine decarboxylase [Pelagicoccus sp. SDUM812003]MDQ8203816.1 archaetidylserine decarboxylase [Pelagicoccus sp. SDUM812003]